MLQALHNVQIDGDLIGSRTRRIIKGPEKRRSNRDNGDTAKGPILAADN